MLEQIKKRIKEKILCVYYGGSVAYGLNDDSSDIDLMVIAESTFQGTESITFEYDNKKIEIFKLSRECFRDVQNIEEDTNSFTTIHADNILCCKDEANILFLDDSYKEEFLDLVNNSWSKDKVSKFLKRFIDFFGLTLGLKQNIKKHYHVYRIRAMLDSFDETGSFSLVYNEPFKTKMIEHKNKFKNLPNSSEEIKQLLRYIDDYAERLKRN